MSSEDAAQRALDIINNLGGPAEEFRRKWLTLHAFSTEFEKGNQRETLIETIEQSVPEKDAEDLINRFENDIRYLVKHLVGDLRFSNTHHRFYQNAERDLAQLCSPNQDATARLGHLVCVVYQVRCNTEHGRKKLGTERSQKLFEICTRVLDDVIRVLLKGLDAA